MLHRFGAARWYIVPPHMVGVERGRAEWSAEALPPPSCRAGSRRRVARWTLAGALLLPGVLALSAAGTQAKSWNVGSGDVRVHCRMTIGGSFEAVTDSLSGRLGPSEADPAALAGELRVDLSSLDTDNGLRNRHLRENYLEVERGPEFQHAVLSGITLDRPLPEGGGDAGFSATLLVHGVRQSVTGEASFGAGGGGQIPVEATFSLSLETFDIPPPRYLGVGVRDEVQVRVTFDLEAVGSPSSGP